MNTCHPYRPAGGNSTFESCAITGCTVTVGSFTDATFIGGCARTANKLGADLYARKSSAFKSGKNSQSVAVTTPTVDTVAYTGYLLHNITKEAGSGHKQHVLE